MVDISALSLTDGYLTKIPNILVGSMAMRFGERMENTSVNLLMINMFYVELQRQREQEEQHALRQQDLPRQHVAQIVLHVPEEQVSLTL